MAGRVVCVANNKGGVGKTTVTVALAEAIAYSGRGPVVVVDLDPQLNASVVLSGATTDQHVPWLNNRTIVTYLESTLGGPPLNANSVVTPVRNLAADRGVNSALSYVSGSQELVIFERRRLLAMNQPLPQVQTWFLDKVGELIKTLRDSFAIVLIDCPPGFSLTNEAALSRADMVLMPVATTRLAVMGLESYIVYIERTGLQHLISRSLILKTMVQNTVQSQRWESAIDELASRHNIGRNKIRQSTAWAAAMDREAGHRTYSSTYNGIDSELESVAQELLERLEGTSQ
jgi:chromosome partitioning protein